MVKKNGAALLLIMMIDSACARKVYTVIIIVYIGNMGNGIAPMDLVQPSIVLYTHTNS